MLRHAPYGDEACGFIPEQATVVCRNISLSSQQVNWWRKTENGKAVTRGKPRNTQGCQKTKDLPVLLSLSTINTLGTR